MANGKTNGSQVNGIDKSAKNGKKYLFISRYALIGDLAYTVLKEGNEVKYYIQVKSEKNICDGFVEKVDNWEDHKDWADVIVFDDCEFGNLPERLRKEGKLVIGGNAYTDRLEFDRDFGQGVMKEAGMTMLPSWDFTSFDDAIKFVEENPGRYVVKPSGRAQNEKVLSFVGQEEDGRDILAILQHYKVGWGNKIKTFQVQKYMAGVEVAIGGFFNGTDFLFPICINFEHKKMFNDEIGPSTGEMGTSMFWTGPNTLYQETLGRMREQLMQAGYIGYFDINCIVNTRNIYPLEITSRFGYPTISIQMEGITSPWGDILFNLASRQSFSIKAKRGFQLGVVVAVPPYPFSDHDTFEKFSDDAVVIFRKPMTEGVHPGDIKLQDKEWRLAGSSGYALIVTGSGSTMEDAKREAYNRIKNIIIPNMFYRTDIGDRWHRDGDLLQTWGYLNDIPIEEAVAKSTT